MTIQKINKIEKSNPVAKAMQNKRFHEKVKGSKKTYKRTDNKKAIKNSMLNVDNEIEEEFEYTNSYF